MRFALKVADGEHPGFRVIEDPADILPGEILTEAMPAEDELWDSATKSLRMPTEAEKLEEAKSVKEEEIAAAVMEELTPLFSAGRGREESIALIAAHVEAICRALSIPVDPRLSTVAAAGRKAQSKKQAIESAQDDRTLDDVRWT